MSFFARLIHAIGWVLLLFAVLFCSLASIYLWQWHQRVPTATTLAGFSRSQIPMQQLLFIETREGDFYLWVSSVPKFGVPSGPTAYAFDSRGNLLDWGVETGTGRSIDYFCGKQEQGVPIDVVEAIRRIKN